MYLRTIDYISISDPIASPASLIHLSHRVACRHPSTVHATSGHQIFVMKKEMDPGVTRDDIKTI